MTALAAGPDRRSSDVFDRVPPQDLAAEQSVLGGMLLSKDAIADVVEVVRGEDFYRPAHQTVFDTILALYARGEPADAVTVCAELARAGELLRAGGAPYLHTLISSVPTAANAGYYASIVTERAILRRLAEASVRIGQLAYSAGADVDQIVDRAQAEVYAVTDRRLSEDYIAIEHLVQPTLDEMEALAAGDGAGQGVPTGFADLDELTGGGLHPSQLVVMAGRPSSGKTTLALDCARSAAIAHGMPTVVFSLEMSRTEITMRLLSAEAKVALQKMRTGRLNEEDWARLSRRMAAVSDAPLYIDDSPNLTLMEIRAKARRLKQRHGLRLVVVDYLQLMSSPRRVESRQQEVAEFSRSLKLLAKELDVPVLALSQLNRGPEQRQDKKPMLADLRDSGCLTASTRVLRADTGAEVSIGELVASGERNIPVWSLDERLRMSAQTMTHAFPSGRKEVFRLRLASGRRIEATANHPFRTLEGWQALGRLAVGDRVAVPRRIPAPQQTRAWPEPEVVLLAHLLGDGSFVRRQPIRYASIDEANLQAVERAALHFNITGVRDDYPAARVTTLRLPAPYRLARGRRHPIALWLEQLGLFGLRSHEKFVPEEVFGLSTGQVRLFLRHLWATDGSVTWTGGRANIYYSSTSRRLVDDVAHLLLRFGVQTRLKEIRKPGYRPCYNLTIRSSTECLRFLDNIGVHGARGVIGREVSERLRTLTANPNLDTIPVEVWSSVRKILTDKPMTQRQFATAMATQYRGSMMWKHAPSRLRLERVATVLDDADLQSMATTDVFWDQIAAIDHLGTREVYDATVLGTHNFIADGIAVHNSIEQDADLVMLIHREDLYDRETARAGEADLLVAKHRNGPTGTVTVAFQGHYSRFVDMAR